MRYHSGSEYSSSPESGNQEFFVNSAESSVSGNSWSAQPWATVRKQGRATSQSSGWSVWVPETGPAGEQGKGGIWGWAEELSRSMWGSFSIHRCSPNCSPNCPEG